MKKDGVGTYSITFEKKLGEIWPYAFANEEVVPIWEEIMERDKDFNTKFIKKFKEAEAVRKENP